MRGEVRVYLKAAHQFADTYGTAVTVGGRVVIGGCDVVPKAVEEISSTRISSVMCALIMAARRGIPLEGGRLYTTQPTLSVADVKAISLVGIKAVYIHAKPSRSGTIDMLEILGIDVSFYEKDIGLCKPSV